MKFDTVIIGGGLSGLMCGIRLQQQGKKCVIVSIGQSALHFSSGSFDLYSSSDDLQGSIIEDVKTLIKNQPKHPYAKMGIEEVEKLMNETKSIFTDAGINTYSDKDKNHLRLTPMGKFSPTWLTAEGYVISKSEKELLWKSVVVINIKNYLDAFPNFVADELAQLGVKTKVEIIDSPALKTLHNSPNGLIATSIARELDKEVNRQELLSLLKEKSEGYETIFLPACFGMKTMDTVNFLSKELNKPIYLVPTLPPSVAGSSMQKKLTRHFCNLGGVYMLGDTMVKTELENNEVKRVYSVNHTDIPFTGDNFVLATGGFFSKGLIANNKTVKEPLFNLDVDFKSNRFEWYDKTMFDTQEYQSFGVKTDNMFRGLVNGSALNNLYVSGAILEGFNPIKESSGGGVSILSALFVADQILKK